MKTLSRNLSGVDFLLVIVFSLGETETDDMKNYALPTILVFVLLGLFLGVMPSLAQERQKKKLKKKRARAERLSLNINNPHGFIDGHVHLNDLNMQLELMKKNRIARAIAFWGRNSTNESLIESFRDHPQKLIPFVSVSPERNKYRVLWKQNDPKLLAILEAQLKTGVFKGIGEISVTHFPGMGFPEADFSPNSTLMKGIMRLAEKYKVPVTIHCEVTRIREFSELLYEFKIVKVIWAHGGYTPYFLANRMLEKHPNLIYELSARTWLDHPRSSDYTIFKSNSEVWKQWLDLVEANPRRFIVGTDSSNHSAERDQRKIESVQLFLGLLTPETRTRVAQENLLELVQ